MRHFHKIQWPECLSHQVWEHLKQGWPEDDDVNFFWGLAGKNIQGIQQCMDWGLKWYYVDVGYLTQQITRYPTPKIHDIDKTYFRIVRGGLHTIRGKVGPGRRLQHLESQGIDCQFKGWDTGEEKRNHILLAPSSQTVTMQVNGMTQEDWIEEVTLQLKQHTDKEIVLRNKPRPGNQWWNTDIKDELKGAHCLVTNMSLSAIDAILNQVPVICHQRNVASFVCSKDISKIEKPMRPGHRTINEWLKMITENQFTLTEMADGTAYKILQEQDV